MSNEYLSLLPPDTPLFYNQRFQSNGIKNILLIDKNVKNYQQFYYSVKNDTLAIVYAYNSKMFELIELLNKNFTSIERIGIVFDCSSDKEKLFLDNCPFFLINKTHYDSNLELLIHIINKFSIKNIDFLACNTLNYQNWSNYYSILTTETKCIVGASNDSTGNLKYGGDWVMENTNEDIEKIYFIQTINYYNHLLGGNENVKTFTFTYTNDIIIKVNIDTNFNFSGFDSYIKLLGVNAPWLYDFNIYHNNTKIYGLSDLYGLHIILPNNNDINDLSNFSNDPNIFSGMVLNIVPTGRKVLDSVVGATEHNCHNIFINNGTINIPNASLLCVTISDTNSA